LTGLILSYSIKIKRQTYIEEEALCERQECDFVGLSHKIQVSKVGFGNGAEDIADHRSPLPCTRCIRQDFHFVNEFSVD
jgi:hypothetical protein